MENNADFFGLWLGLSKLGVVSAFINSNLKNDPLAHSINVAETSAVITSNSLLPALRSALDQNLFKQKLKFYSVDKVDDPKSVVELQLVLSDSSEPTPSNSVEFTGACLLMFGFDFVFRSIVLHLYKW